MEPRQEDKAGLEGRFSLTQLLERHVLIHPHITRHPQHTLGNLVAQNFISQRSVDESAASLQVTEAKLAPPWWVHVLLWGPITLGLSLGLMRLAKGLFVALEFRNDAGEGQA